jgi:uncharacterized protein
MDLGVTTKVVIDTNVWIRAALSSRGAPAQVLRLLLQNGLPVFSEATFGELEVRLWKPKFDRFISMDARHMLLRDAKASAHWVVIPNQITAIAYSRNEDDDKFIHTALAAKAAWLVSGDKDLLVLERVLSVEIITPAAALERLKNIF